MKICHINIVSTAKQRGVVLFIALIALVVMSLAAVALIRSVDTSTVIAGNLSFKQSAVTSGDVGLESAFNWIEQQAINNPLNLDVDNGASAYFSTYNPDPSAGLNLTSDALWVEGFGQLAAGAGIEDGVDQVTGNRIRYVIERMCLAAIPPNDTHCLFGASEVGTGSKADKDATMAGAIIDGSQSPMYRVTARVEGPRNTVSYVQAYVY